MTACTCTGGRCEHCRAWADMRDALQHVDVGMDTRKLRRALLILTPRKRYVTPAMFDKLVRRIEDLEAEVGAL